MIAVGTAVTLDLDGYNREMLRRRPNLTKGDEEFHRDLFRDGWANSMGIVLEVKKHARGSMGCRVLWSLSGGDTVRLWHVEDELNVIGEK